MLLTYKIRSYIFSAENEKDAYLKGCKKLAKYMASKKYSNLSFKIERSGKNTFIFSIFANIDLKTDKEKFCSLCKEYHCSFFVNEEYNCSRCNLRSFFEREHEKMKVSKSYFKKKLE